MGFLVKKYTCPVIFLGCPGRPGLVFVGPCYDTIFTMLGGEYNIIEAWLLSSPPSKHGGQFLNEIFIYFERHHSKFRIFKRMKNFQNDC